MRLPGSRLRVRRSHTPCGGPTRRELLTIYWIGSEEFLGEEERISFLEAQWVHCWHSNEPAGADDAARRTATLEAQLANPLSGLLTVSQRYTPEDQPQRWTTPTCLPRPTRKSHPTSPRPSTAVLTQLRSIIIFPPSLRRALSYLPQHVLDR